MANRDKQPGVAPLPFGIPQLDQLLGYDDVLSEDLAICLESAVSLTIVGQDGTGKSVFALHLAATYHALRYHARESGECRVDESAPAVFYVSSDLRYESALKVWNNFRLDYPWHRYVPFAQLADIKFRRERLEKAPFHVELFHCVPSDGGSSDKSQSTTRYLERLRGGSREIYDVAFLDLATQTTGDDWLFLARLLSSVPRSKGSPPNLLIVDSVAGFETLVGDRNSFGETMTRRAKIAQMVRAASNSWHTVFVVEEPELGKHHPEEYVTDTVIHLTRQGTQDRIRRVLEIEKCRARAFAAGSHPFEIRSGRGSSTGGWENPDDPMTLLHERFRSKCDTLKDEPYHAYVQVFPSLHYLSGTFSSRIDLTRPPREGEPAERSNPLPTAADAAAIIGSDSTSGQAGRRLDFNVAFGVPYLDSLLGSLRSGDGQIKTNVRGLPPGSITALIGEEGTLKASLAEQFLMEGFRYFPEALDHALHVVTQWWQRCKGGSDEEIWSFLKDQQVDPHMAIPEFVRSRMNSVPGDWLYRPRGQSDFEGQRIHVRNLARSTVDGRDWFGHPDADTPEPGAWRLLSEQELRTAHQAVAEKFKRPLSARHDVVSFVKWQPFPEEEDKLKEYYESRGLATAESQEAYQRFIVALALLRASSGLITPVVFLATHDTSAERLADRILDRLWKEKIVPVLEKHGLFTEKMIADDRAWSPEPWLREGESETLADVCRHALVRIIERYVIVRRLELVDASSQQLWQITRECVTHALHLIGHPPSQPALGPTRFAGEVRVVMSDLRLLRDTYPGVASDPLFLPTIVFRLRRLGVTAVLVDSDRGRPDQDPAHAMNGALRSLVDHQIFTWKVPFFGEQRIAITVLPPIMPGEASVIRELKPVRQRLAEGRETRVIDVDPHFELYAGVERGEPSAVPLEIVLYGETPAFQKYVEEEKAVFERLFAPVGDGKDVIHVRKAPDYHALRDYCHLPADTKLTHSLVFMIDGYWGISTPGALRSQQDYLYGELDSHFGDGREDYMDVFDLFKPTRQHELQSREGTSGMSQQAMGARNKRRADFFSDAPYSVRRTEPLRDRVPLMWDFGFLLVNEDQWSRAEQVPLQSRALSQAANEGHRHELQIRNDAMKSEYNTVHDVWDRMTRVAIDGQDTLDLTVRRPLDGHGVVPWRYFLEACTAVAKVETVRQRRKIAAFDFFTGGVDSLIALFFEMWFSEIFADARRITEWLKKDGSLAANDHVAAAKQWADRALEDVSGFSLYDADDSSRGTTRPRLFLQDLLSGNLPHVVNARGSRPLSLTSIYSRIADDKTYHADSKDTSSDRCIRACRLQAAINGYSLQWYKAWLLLLDSLDFDQYFEPAEPFDFKPRDPAFEAVASRHWYRTACAASVQQQNEGSEYRTRIAARLPGHYAVRGGWFLAVANGSRSYRLADRALDIFSSRRANRSRLHRGLGLPTRDIFEEGGGETSASKARVMTGLSIASEDGVRRVSYVDLLQLGEPGDHRHRLRADDAADPFRWLFRAEFRDYDRQARVVRRWMNRIFSWSMQYRYQLRAKWRSNFVSYDMLANGDLTWVADYPSFRKKIPEFLDAFVDELNMASASTKSQRSD